MPSPIPMHNQGVSYSTGAPFAVVLTDFSICSLTAAATSVFRRLLLLPRLDMYGIFGFGWWTCGFLTESAPAAETAPLRIRTRVVPVRWLDFKRALLARQKSACFTSRFRGGMQNLTIALRRSLFTVFHFFWRCLLLEFFQTRS